MKPHTFYTLTILLPLTILLALVIWVLPHEVSVLIALVLISLAPTYFVLMPSIMKIKPVVKNILVMLTILLLTGILFFAQTVNAGI